MKTKNDQPELNLIKSVGVVGKTVLEVGCGNGRLTTYLSENGAKLFAIDTDEVRVAEAKAKVPTAKFLVAQGESLPFDDEFFDLIIFGKSLHHQDPIAALAEAQRVLKMAGKVVIIEPSPGSFYQSILKLFEDETVVLNKAKTAIQKCGLKLRKEEKFFNEKFFLDAADFYEDCLETFEVPGSEGLKKAFTAALGHKAKDAPLVIEAELKFYLLSKD